MFVATEALNGVSFGMLLFLLAAGMSVVFGLLRIVNLAHGSFYLLGAYVGLTVLGRTHSFAAATAAGALAVAAVGIVLERGFLRRLAGQEMAQVVLTFGFLFVFAAVALRIWGGAPTTLSLPRAASGSVDLGPVVYPTYRLLVIAVGLVIAGALIAVQRRTRVGASVRAAVDDPEMARGIGINVPVLVSVVFAIGALLGGLAGVVGGPFVGAYPGADLDVLLLTIAVVVVGGLGSVRGALVASLMIGLIDDFGKVLLPHLSLFLIYAPVALVLAFRPEGLFGHD